MQFSDIIKRSWNDNILFSALIELTYRCNLDCFFCYNDTSLQGTPLSRGQYFKLFEELRALGTMNLTLSGGEPLAHPDFFELGNKARQLGFVVRIKSNGHALRERLALRIKKEIDPFMIEISLHGACAETHDRQTRVPGSFEILMQNLHTLNKLGLRFKLNSALTAWNSREAEDMYAIAENFGVNLQFDTVVTARDNGDRSPLDIAPSTKDTQSLFRLQKRMVDGAEDQRTADTETNKKLVPSEGRHCGAGSSTLAIDPFGNIYPCVQWRRTIGTLHEQDINAIWMGNKELEAIRHDNKEAGRQVKKLGDDARVAAFCPGLAYSQTGQPAEIYPAAQLRHDLWRSVNY